MKTDTLLRLGLLLLLVLIGAAVLLFLPVREYLDNFLSLVKEIGPWGPPLLAAAYVPSAVFLVPGTLLTLGAGFAFGVVVGTLAVSLGSVSGACAAFLVGRFLARGWVEQRIAGNPRFRAIDQAVAEQGFKIVLLTRLSPAFPYTLLNYAFGLSRVRFRDFLLASWIGMLPGTVMYVYIGSLVQNLAELAAGNRERTPGELVLFYGGLAVTVGLTVYVTRLARRALARVIPAGDNEPIPSRSEQP
jgi:uncharacterized membrane protein YdjX (TVP38/TMEM64 family)